MILLLLVEPPVFDAFEYRLANELAGALEVQPQRLLHHHPEESEALQLPRALQRTDVDGTQAPVAHELSYRLLGPLVVPSNEDIERLACHLAFNQRRGKGGVEGLDDPRASRRGARLGGKPVEGLV